MGYHLATGKIPTVYLQNSGLGNTINPLISMADRNVGGFPLLMMIGWRGKPGEPDEPQHLCMGKSTLDLLKVLKIPFLILKKETSLQTEVVPFLKSYSQTEGPFALCVEPQVFSPESKSPENPQTPYPLSRRRALEILLELSLETDRFICTTGKASRELYEIRMSRAESHEKDFLVVGAMGHCSQIGISLAVNSPGRRFFCLDGDGSLLMHLGNVTELFRSSPSNFHHILLNNGAHESVGGQPTMGFKVDWKVLSRSLGYNHYFHASNEEEIREGFSLLSQNVGPSFFEIKINLSVQEKLARPSESPRDNKRAFMAGLGKTI
jgi:phosphonopyruvate decarboxylase